MKTTQVVAATPRATKMRPFHVMSRSASEEIITATTVDNTMPSVLRRKANTTMLSVMLASVLNSPLAVHASIQVVRAFVRLRALLTSHADLAPRLDELERLYDRRFRVVFEAIRRLMQPPEAPERPRIGFRAQVDQ